MLMTYLRAWYRASSHHTTRCRPPHLALVKVSNEALHERGLAAAGHADDQHRKRLATRIGLHGFAHRASAKQKASPLLDDDNLATRAMKWGISNQACS